MAKTPEERREANRLRAQGRAFKGLCCSCNRPALSGTRRCEIHTKAASVQAGERYRSRKTAKICPLCRDPAKSIVEGKTCCRDCLSKQADSSAARRETLGEDYNIERKALRQEREALHLCIVCGKEPAEPGRVSCKKHLADFNRRAKKLAMRRRRAVITHYGGKCACCGETTFEFLEIDHVNNDGAAHRREIGKGNSYKWLIANNYPPGFQVLCSNCNHAKGRYGVCPHEARRQDRHVLDACGPCIGCGEDCSEVLQVDHTGGGYRVLCPTCNVKAARGIALPREKLAEAQAAFYRENADDPYFEG